MINRKIRITVSDPDSIWKEIEHEIFSNFSFQMPTIFPEQAPGDISANLSYEFIPEDSNLENYIKLNSDPFLNSFYSIRVQMISDEPGKYQSFQSWVEDAKSSGKPWCVFLAQERYLFISPNVGSFSQLDSIPSERLFTIQYKSPLRLPDQQKEQIQTKFQDLLVDSLLEIDSKTMDMIHLGKHPAPQTARLRVWRYLMFFYFGFLETAIKCFYDLYTEFSKHDLKCDTIPPIEPSWITLYPFINGDDDMSILIFALSGCFASFYIKKDYNKILELFMRNLTILQSKSTIDQNIVLSWASQSLEVMIDLDFNNIQNNTENSNNNETNNEKEANNDNHLHITEQLLMQLFKNRLVNGNQKQIDEAYHKSMIRLSEKKFSRTALNVLYSNKHLFNELTECWSFGQKAALYFVEEAIKEKKYSRIQYFAKPLFLDCSPDEIKLELFNVLSKLDSEILIKDPFCCQIKFDSDAFYTTIKSDYTFIINVKCKFKSIDLFPNVYDSATLIMKMKKNEKDFITREFTTTNVKINENFQFLAFLNEGGKWNFDCLILRKESLSFSWQIDKQDYNIYVSEYERPNINVTFPSLIGFCQLLPITFSVDFVTIEKEEVSFKLFFDSPSLTIPDQHGNADIHNSSQQAQPSKIAVDSKATFNISDSILTFNKSIDRSNFDCDSKFIVRINCKQNGHIDSSNLHVVASISGMKYEYLFHIVFVFPIECSLRFISEKFAHICLRNNASVPFIIESAEMQPSTWGKQIINAGEELFLIGQRSYENDVLKAFIKDESGSSIAMSWDINDKVMRPIIKAELKGSPICGCALKIKLLDIPQCEFHVENTKNFIVSGITKIEEFKGGNLVFSIIPLKSGLLRLPFISLNHVSHIIQQEYINVNQPKGTLLSPLVKM